MLIAILKLWGLSLPVYLISLWLCYPAAILFFIYSMSILACSGYFVIMTTFVTIWVLPVLIAYLRYKEYMLPYSFILHISFKVLFPGYVMGSALYDTTLYMVADIGGLILNFTFWLLVLILLETRSDTIQTSQIKADDP